jgi:uncharacterized membrane protein YgcG
VIPFGLGAAALTGILSLAGILILGFSFRRDPGGSPDLAMDYSTPPKPIPAALAARLTRGNYGFLGSLFSLAQRGVVNIEEGPKKWGSRTFEVVRLQNTVRLEPHEVIFMDSFFHKAKNDRVNLSNIASLANDGRFTKALDDELTMSGWRDADRASRRMRFLALTGFGVIFGLVIILISILIGGFLMETNNWALTLAAILMGSGIALVCFGLVGLLVAGLISTHSEEGVRQAKAWIGFSKHLLKITRSRDAFVTPELFERYLSYAAGFGIATEWAKFFQKMTEVPIPVWFHGLQDSLDDGSFVAILAAISAANSSASAGADGGGGGSSGGGSSGAG